MKFHGCDHAGLQNIDQVMNENSFQDYGHLVLASDQKIRIDFNQLHMPINNQKFIQPDSTMPLHISL